MTIPYQIMQQSAHKQTFFHQFIKLFDNLFDKSKKINYICQHLLIITNY